MANIERFEDIIAWQKGKELALITHHALVNTKDYSFRDQIWRAALSVSNNIAEGFERKSNKEFKQFLFIAKGSAGEVRSMTYIGKELNLFDEEKVLEIKSLSLEISKIISGLIKKL
ncbi:MAG: four helix bundle protein [Candidatus Saccharimonadales bacterium]